MKPNTAQTAAGLKIASCLCFLQPSGVRCISGSREGLNTEDGLWPSGIFEEVPLDDDDSTGLGIRKQESHGRSSLDSGLPPVGYLVSLGLGFSSLEVALD